MSTQQARQRASVLLRHVQPGDAVPPCVTIHAEEAAGKAAASDHLRFPVPVMQHWFDDNNHQVRERTKQALQEAPLFTHRYDITMDQQRELTLQRARRLAQQDKHLVHVRESIDNPLRYQAFYETLAYYDGSLCVKLGVQWNLFAGTVLNLGTERHQSIVDDIHHLRLPGCFALTELAHGSNVRGIGTRAEYDADKQEFIITTPDDASQKCWIGNAAKHGVMAIVFAQLHLAGRCYGVHPFLVRIRGDDGQPAPRVRINDNGVKLGMNGIDNGRLWFDGVRIPRTALLNRFADVTPDGQYRSPIKDDAARFVTMISELVVGRVIVASAANNIAKLGVMIAIKYALQRRQFGPPGQPEGLLMDYTSHQMRLVPPLAKIYAMNSALKSLKQDYVRNKVQPTPQGTKNVHTVASGLKAYVTWAKATLLQECREACGGQGFSALNRIGVGRADSDVDLTYEGDNTILLQEVARGVLSDLRHEFKRVGVAGMLKQQLVTSVRERNWFTTFNASPDAVRSLAFLRAALQYRARASALALANALKAKIGKGPRKMSPFQGWNDSLDLVLHAGHCRVEQLVIDAFVRDINVCKEASLTPMLRHLALVFGLDCLVRDLAWFTIDGYLGADKAQQVKLQLRAAVLQLRPYLKDLVDAFGIPDGLHSAPIATGSDYVANFGYNQFPPQEPPVEQSF